MGALTALAVMAGLVWFWASSLRAREQTLTRARDVCMQMRVQFLDQTVALTRLGVGRNARGQLLMRRWYQFDFSTNGTDRHRGMAALLGTEVEFIRLEHPEGPVIMTSGPLRRVH